VQPCMRSSPQCHDIPLQPAHARSSEVLTWTLRSRCRRNRQPRASAAHPCTAPCARRCRSTTQSDSRTRFTLPSVLHWSMHTVRQQPPHTQRQLATAVHRIATSRQRILVAGRLLDDERAVAVSVLPLRAYRADLVRLDNERLECCQCGQAFTPAKETDSQAIGFKD
jgi:hypothetical protein